jgi:hypothetical protein
MNRNSGVFTFLILTLVALGGCSSAPSDSETKKAAPQTQKIQGRVQVLTDPAGTGDAELNAGGPSNFLWEGTKRYRLFTRRKVELMQGGEYIVEGINAQKVIEELGDPDQGKKGYPLRSSCDRIVKMAWPGMPFDEVDVKAAVLRARVARYPARTVFLVTKTQFIPSTGKDDDKWEPKKDVLAQEKDIPTVAVAADKQRALLVEGSPVQPAPLWEPAGETVRCKVLINSKGKIVDLETGTQLCEIVPWDQFKYQPPVQGGRPVKVRTEVEVRFEPRK